MLPLGGPTFKTKKNTGMAGIQGVAFSTGN
jgi:hypothetical protein